MSNTQLVKPAHAKSKSLADSDLCYILRDWQLFAYSMSADDRLTIGVGFMPSQLLLWRMASKAARMQRVLPDSWFDKEGILIADVKNPDIKGLLKAIHGLPVASVLDQGGDAGWREAADQTHPDAWQLCIYVDGDRKVDVYRVLHGTEYGRADEKKWEAWNSTTEGMEDFMFFYLPHPQLMMMPPFNDDGCGGARHFVLAHADSAFLSHLGTSVQKEAKNARELRLKFVSDVAHHSKSIVAKLKEANAKHTEEVASLTKGVGSITVHGSGSKDNQSNRSSTQSTHRSSSPQSTHHSSTHSTPRSCAQPSLSLMSRGESRLARPTEDTRGWKESDRSSRSSNVSHAQHASRRKHCSTWRWKQLPCSDFIFAAGASPHFHACHSDTQHESRRGNGTA